MTGLGGVCRLQLHFKEKAIKVKTTQRSSKTPSSQAGILATFRRLLRAQGAGPARPRPRICAALATSVALAGACAVSASPAFAAEGPFHFEHVPYEEHIFATRAIVVMSLVDEAREPAAWHAEYAPEGPTCKPLAAPPVETGCSWNPAGAGSTGKGDNFPQMAFGHEDSVDGEQDQFGIVHHLAPSTTYYARFVANLKSEEAEETVQFTTRPEGKPEIPKGEVDHGRTEARATSPTSARFIARIESNGPPTEYEFAYSTSESGPWIPFTSGATGTITTADDFGDPEATTTGLTPDTKYFTRVKATNSCATGCGSAEAIETFTTPTAKPSPTLTIRNVTATSAYLAGQIEPHGSETKWRFEFTTEPANPGSWAPVQGAQGTVSQAEAEALPEGIAANGIGGRLTGLSASTTYYVRLFAENECPSFCGAATSAPQSFETAGPPTATTFLIHALHGESLRLLGSVNPNSLPTAEEQLITIEGAPTGGTFTLSFDGDTTAPIAFNAAGGEVSRALRTLPSHPDAYVFSPFGGPYTVAFLVKSAGVDQPQILCDGAGLTGGSSPGCSVTTTQPGGEGYDTHYHFEYISEKEFKADGNAFGAGTQSTPAVDLGVGRPDESGSVETESVGADLPTLVPGEGYRYRIFAVNTSPGEAVVRGAEQTLEAPVAAPLEPAPACPNQATRTGPSANLPDCRAYEQLTPVDKNGTLEIYSYGGGSGSEAAVEGTLPGSDGDHLMFGRTLVHWGNGPGDGQSPYFFNRDPGQGWQITAATAQPEAGMAEYSAQVFSPDLTRFGFEALLNSNTVEFKLGPPGGPYSSVVTVPRSQVGDGGGWIVASADFSKLILAVEDRKLPGLPHSATTSGNDLYEYSAGELRQLNVGANGKTIGTCGARMVNGQEGESPRRRSSVNSVSADGSRVFFEAVPGSVCSEPTHLYMREGGATTLDIGNYRFVEADAQGATLLIEHGGQLFRYDTQTHATEPVPAGETLAERRYSYTVSGGEYHLPPELSGFEAHGGNALGIGAPLGRALFGSKEDLPEQILRYDRRQHLIQCLSCASAFDPEPQLASIFGGGPTATTPVVSANGDYAFFDTPAALLPADVDGELAPGPGHSGNENEREYSFSSDVYEWRRDGLDGCAHLQGCLSLITAGRGGYLNLLLGADPSGHDVFISTGESLLPRDDDTAADIYDARIGGGFAEPGAEVECAGDACFHPLPAPDDPSPASLNYHGPGNEHRKKHHHKKHHHKRAHRRAAKHNRRAGR